MLSAFSTNFILWSCKIKSDFEVQACSLVHFPPYFEPCTYMPTSLGCEGGNPVPAQGAGGIMSLVVVDLGQLPKLSVVLNLTLMWSFDLVS